jgi:dATP pyrophosphohydrolase
MSSPALKRPVSVVVVHSTSGQILLLERVRPEGFWQSLTGSLEKGETAREATERELMEETGFGTDGRLIDLELVQRFPIAEQWRERFPADVTHNTEHAFSLQMATTPEPRINPTEHVAYQWLAGSDALDIASSWSDRAAIELVLSRAQIKG